MAAKVDWVHLTDKLYEPPIPQSVADLCRRISLWFSTPSPPKGSFFGTIKRHPFLSDQILKVI